MNQHNFDYIAFILAVFIVIYMTALVWVAR